MIPIWFTNTTLVLFLVLMAALVIAGYRSQR